MAGRKKELLRRALHVMKWIPTSSKLLYPFWLSAQLDVLDEEARFAHLPEAFNSFVIAYASDIHFGAFLGKDRLQKLADRLNAMQADMILLGGDYGETTETAIELFKFLPALSAPHGVYAVMGNHDLLGSAEEIARLENSIASCGITLLRNGYALIEKNGARLCLCATDDIQQGYPDPASLLPGIDAASFVIFAPHSPDILPRIDQQEGFHFDLALCGHTHGGQLVVLGHSLHSSSVYRDTYARGWMDVHGGRLMVSHGVGTSLMPIRLGVRPQIHRIVLKKQD